MAVPHRSRIHAPGMPPYMRPGATLWPSVDQHCRLKILLLLGGSASSTRIPGESLRVPERTWQEMTAVVTEGQKQRAGSKHRGDHWGRVSQAHINLGILCSENVGHSPKATPIHSLSARLSQQAQGRTATLAAATAIAASASAPDTATVSPESRTPIKNAKQH